jgi:hypothetical protein
VPRPSSSYQTPLSQLEPVRACLGRKRCKCECALVSSAVSLPSQFRSLLPSFSAPRSTSLYRISLISPILRPTGDVKHNNRGSAAIALSCPSFDAVQHRLAASPVLRFTCSLARPKAAPSRTRPVLPSIQHQYARLQKSYRSRRHLASEQAFSNLIPS